MYYFLFIIICLTAISCGESHIPLNEKEVKERALPLFTEIHDTADIGVSKMTVSDSSHWFVAYNKIQITPRLYLFHSENRYEASHTIPLKNKQNGSIEKVYFVDVTYDGEYELLIELHYDYDIAYQGRELVVYQHPFDSTRREIFSYPFEQVWEKIDSFDHDFGTPIHHEDVANHASIEFYEDIILLRGIVNHKKNHLAEYKWDKLLQGFRLEKDDDLHEADEEETHGQVSYKVKGNKILMEVVAHDDGCRSYVLEDAEHHPVALRPQIHDALLCSPVTSLSDGGRFLVYMNMRNQTLELYDFELDTIQVLLENMAMLETISDISWSSTTYHRLGFIVINPEEYPYNTRIFVYTVAPNGHLHKQYFDQKVFYHCEQLAGCAPTKDYDYRFSNSGNFVYRIQNTGKTEDDFSIIQLSENHESTHKLKLKIEPKNRKTH